MGQAGPVAEVIKAGLLRAYADCGWDAVPGTPPPGARTQLAVPAFAQLRNAALAVGAGISATTRAFGPRWTASCGPSWSRCGAGKAGAASSKAVTPPTSRRCCAGSALFAGDGLAGDQTASFLCGVVMAMDRGKAARTWAAKAAFRPRGGGGRHGPEAAGWFSGLAREMRAHGTEVINAESSRFLPFAL